MTIAISLSQFNRLRKELQKDYAHLPSISFVSWVSRKELGCSFREHQEYNSAPIVYIDIYDEALYTMFTLKYSDILKDISPKAKIKFSWNKDKNNG